MYDDRMQRARVLQETRARRTAMTSIPFTPREVEVAWLLAEGLSNKLIADRLGIAEHTSKFHVNHVMLKLGASTRTQAAVTWVLGNLVEATTRLKPSATLSFASV